MEKFPWNYWTSEEWDVCLSERLQPDVRARIIRDVRPKWSDLTFSLLCILDSTFIAIPIIYLRIFRVVSGQRLANLTKETPTKIRIDHSFDHFYANVACKCEGLLGEPTLRRKRHTPARL